ncbi:MULTISPECIES: M23 family metallopeptidase [Microbacterium]|uniref:M23 family metallopeptidase n=1 Tax=Microbacterium TaxID=33882 RepID=UPI00146ECCF8|nr:MULTISPECIES: M23 family metallopeptidase [Microbacterium]
MPAPVATVTALAGTRTGRRVAVGIVLALALMAGIAITPLIAISFAVVGASAGARGTAAPGIEPAVQGEWGYPLAGAYTKGRGFGYNPVVGCSYCPSQHRGYDMAQGCGSTIYAAGPGEVMTAGVYLDYGNTVRIDHGNGLVTIYGHMQWNSIRVDVGESVSAGTPLGAEGNTGRSFGCHLHFEVRQDNTRLDPQPFMAARGLPLT